MIPSLIIDSHQHVFWHGRDDRGLVEDMDQHGIDKAWLLSWEIPPFEDNAYYHGRLNPQHFRSDGTHAGIPLSDLILAKNRYPNRFILGYCPHPAIRSAPELLRAAVEMWGIQVCGEWKFRIPLDDPRSLELFHTAGELGLPVVLHLDVPYLIRDGKPVYQPNWYGGTVENLERTLSICNKTIFIGHAPGFWREISADAAFDPNVYPAGPVDGKGRLHHLFADYTNLMADLSAGSALLALKRDPENAVCFLTEFAGRLLFGRDYYGKDLHEFLQSLELNRDTIEQIYCRNAERLLSHPPI